MNMRQMTEVILIFKNLEFLWDKFFEDQLLKLGIYAEKIVIYITPYILKSNIRLLMYDYGKEYLIETKMFKCHLEKKQEIIALYRKCHYDLAYSSSYFNKYIGFLSVFSNTDVELKVLKSKLIDEYKFINESLSENNYSQMQSVCFTNKKIEKQIVVEKKKEEIIIVEAVKENDILKQYQEPSNFEKNFSNDSTKDQIVNINSYEENSPKKIIVNIKENTVTVKPVENSSETKFYEDFGAKYKEFMIKSFDLYNRKKFVEILKLKNDCKN
jgi:hypothetical protein